MDYSIIWLLFGKLPVILLFASTMYCCSKKIGAQLTTWSFSAFFVSLSVGATIFPSILGVYIMGLVSLFATLKLLSNQAGAWHHVVWPLTNTFISIILIGRVGCWLAGCCFGEVSDLPWSIHYTDQGFAADYHFDRHQASHEQNLSIHPVQLYESFGLLIMLRLSFWFKSRWGEVSSASLCSAGYLSLYLLLIPFKAYLNNTASLVYLGPVSQLQLALYFMILILGLLAYRFKDSVEDSTIAEHANRSLMKNISLSQGLMLWISISTAAGLSLSLGTPFSTQLSIVGVLLSALALFQNLNQGIKSFDLDYTLSLNDSFEDEFSPKNILTWAFFVAIVPLALFPLVIPSRTDTESQKHSIPQRTWVYKIDPNSKKLIRIGRVDDLGPKELEQLQNNRNISHAWSCAGPNVYLR